MMKLIILPVAVIALVINGVSRPKHLILTISQIILLALVATIDNAILLALASWLVVTVTTNVSRIGDDVPVQNK